MTTKTTQGLTRSQAQKLIAELVVRFSSESARQRLTRQARRSRQSLTEVAWRQAGKLLTTKG